MPLVGTVQPRKRLSDLASICINFSELNSRIVCLEIYETCKRHVRVLLPSECMNMQWPGTVNPPAWLAAPPRLTVPSIIPKKGSMWDERRT
jgi:hypothetical protein